MKSFIKKLSSICVVMLLSSPHITAQTSLITEVYQPGASAGQDALVSNITCNSSDNYENTNYGNSTILYARAWSFNSLPEMCPSGITRTFIRFDDIDFIPNNAVVTNATLTLYGTTGSETNSYPNSYPNKTNPINVGESLSAWNEQVITWNNQPTVDYSTYNITHVASTQDHEDISINVTPIVQNQVTGANNGFCIELQSEIMYRRWVWASSDYGTALKRPKLIVKYYIPCDANFNYSYNTAGAEFTFTPNTYTSGNYYTWNFGDGTAPIGNFGQSINHSFTSSGTYTVCLEVKGGNTCKMCIDICVTKDQEGPQPKANNKEKQGDISGSKNTFIKNLYPNPTKDEITLEINAVNSGTAELTIYDMTGKTVGNKTYSLQEGNQQINFKLSNLTPGIYLCTILTNGQHIEKSFIVE